MEFHKIYKIVFIFGFIYLNFISVNPVSSQSGWISQTLGTRKYVNVNFINSTSGFLIGSDGKILKQQTSELTGIFIQIIISAQL